MIAWWIHLSCSHALAVLIAVVLAVVLLWYAFASLIEAATTDRRPRPWPLVDYSAKRQRQINWLGPRYLLAKPINRRGV